MKKLFWIALLGILSNLTFAQGKVDPSLAEKLQNERNEIYDISIYLTEQADVVGLLEQQQAAKAPSKDFKTTVLKSLRSVADKFQPSVLADLQTLDGIDQSSIQSLWIVNGFELKATADAIKEIAMLEAVDYIEETVYSEPASIERASEMAAPPIPNGHEPGLEVINAHKMWALGYTGYGTIAYVYDTGFDRYHPALESNFRYHNAPMAASFKGTEEDPYSCGDHGTHVAGTICGLDRVRNDTIGVAFNAEFIVSAQFTTCEDKRVSDNVAFQWAVDPDENPNTTDDIPNVLNMSGGRANPNSGICTNTQVQATYATFKAVDMAPIIAAGNEGPDPSTNRSPAVLNYDLVHTFSVGNINADIMTINPSSSRGPSVCFSPDSSLLIKPEVSAPGTNIRSSVVGGGYDAFTGTSMAAPHTAGAFLLLREAFPDLPEEELLLAMYFSAIDMGAPGEDNEYGMGLLDIYAAYEYLIDKGYTPTPPVPADKDVIAIHLETREDLLCEGRLEATFTFENAGADTLKQVSIIFQEASGLFAPDTMKWEGTLLPDEVTTVSYTYPNPIGEGRYELQAQLAMPNGEEDPRDLNNYYKYPFEMLDAAYVSPAISAAVDSNICIGASILLENQTLLTGDQGVYWYSQNNIVQPMAEGETFLTPPLNGPFTYLMDIYTPYTAGKTLTNNNNLVSDQNINRGLVFDVSVPILLKSVKIHAAEPGGRIIKLYDAEGNSLATKLLNVRDIGEQTVELNINVPRGSDYFLTIDAGKSLSHNNTDIDFPYSVTDVIEITKSRDGDADTRFRYYYFYDWEVQALSACGKVAIDLEVSTTDTASMVAFEQSIETGNFFPDIEVQFTDLSPDAVSWFWDFKNGNTSTDQNPANTYQMPGVYQTSLTIRDSKGCNNSIIQPLTLLETSAVKENESVKEQPLLFPNPAFDQITLYLPASFMELTHVKCTILDIQGKIVQEVSPTKGYQEVNVDISNLPSGLFLLTTSTENGVIATNRFVKQ